MTKYNFALAISIPIGVFAQEQTDFEKAFEAYDESNYEKALDLFNSIEANNSSNAEFFLFRGICFSETGNDVKAIYPIIMLLSN